MKKNVINALGFVKKELSQFDWAVERSREGGEGGSDFRGSVSILGTSALEQRLWLTIGLAIFVEYS